MFPVEASPQLAVGNPVLIGDAGEFHPYGPVGQVVPYSAKPYPGEDNGPLRFENHLRVVRVKLPLAEAPTGTQAAKRVRNFRGNLRKVVVQEDKVVLSGDHDVVLAFRFRTPRRFRGVQQALKNLPRRALAGPLLSAQDQDGIRSPGI